MSNFRTLGEIARGFQAAEDMGVGNPFSMAEIALWNQLVEQWNSIYGRHARIEARNATDWYRPVEDGSDTEWVVDGRDGWYEGVLENLERRPRLSGCQDASSSLYPQSSLILRDAAGDRHLLPLVRLSSQKCELLDSLQDLPNLLDPSSDM